MRPDRIANSGVNILIRPELHLQPLLNPPKPASRLLFRRIHLHVPHIQAFAPRIKQRHAKAGHRLHLRVQKRTPYRLTLDPRRTLPNPQSRCNHGRPRHQSQHERNPPPRLRSIHDRLHNHRRPTKLRYIPAPRNLDPHRRILPFVLVIRRQPLPQQTCLHPHNCVIPRIVILRPVKHHQPQRVLLQPRLPPRQRFLHHICKQSA